MNLSKIVIMDRCCETFSPIVSVVQSICPQSWPVSSLRYGRRCVTQPFRGVSQVFWSLLARVCIIEVQHHAQSACRSDFNLLLACTS